MSAKVRVAVQACVVAGAMLLAGCGAAPHPFEPVFGTGVGP
jgi:hypothetical protein